MASATSLDGRVARRLANRARILDTALDMIACGDEVNAETIAERAEVSVRSVYNHFPTVRDLVSGLYERGAERVQPLLDELPTPDAAFDDRVRRWVRVRAKALEALAPIRWRALVAEEQHPDLQPEQESLRKAHRAEVRKMFPELRDEPARHAVVALTGSLGWRTLRRHQGLSLTKACEVIEETIRRLAR